MKNVEFDKYLEFYRGFGPVLKEGLARDWTNREKIADLLSSRRPTPSPGSSRPWRSTWRRCPRGKRRSTT